MGKIAVEHVTKGENRRLGKSKIDYSESLRLIYIWLMTELILFSILLLITVVKEEPGNPLYNTVKEIDALNIMFSLVLSVLLEQMLNRTYINSKRNDMILISEVALTLIVGIVYTVYSILKVKDLDNQLLQYTFYINIAYIIVSTIIVISGYHSRGNKNI